MGNTINKETVFGITYHERKLINEAWILIKQDLSRNGILVFAIYFEDHPEHIKYFDLKHTLTKETIDKDPLIKLHGLRVMKEISHCVDVLDKPEALLHTLRQNALNHRKRLITKAAYDDLRTTILKMMGIQLSHKFTAEMTDAWDKVLKVMFQIITDINDERKCLCPTPGQSGK